MPVYQIKIETEDEPMKTYELEAKDQDTAYDDVHTSDEYCDKTITFLEITLSDCQYTDQQELKDREDAHEFGSDPWGG